MWIYTQSNITNIICCLNYTIIIDKKYNVTSEGIELKTYLISSSELLSSVISPSSSVNIDVLPLPRSIDELYLIKISLTISIYSTCKKLISVGSGIKPIPGTVEQRGKGRGIAPPPPLFPHDMTKHCCYHDCVTSNANL
jgi:hypothetical protein